MVISSETQRATRHAIIISLVYLSFLSFFYFSFPSSLSRVSYLVLFLNSSSNNEKMKREVGRMNQAERKENNEFSCSSPLVLLLLFISCPLFHHLIFLFVFNTARPSLCPNMDIHLLVCLLACSLVHHCVFSLIAWDGMERGRDVHTQWPWAIKRENCASFYFFLLYMRVMMQQR